jgi:hypothetical protein
MPSPPPPPPPPSQLQFLYLTTKGWKTGKVHEIEIWFVEQNEKYYVLSEHKKKHIGFRISFITLEYLFKWIIKSSMVMEGSLKLL